MADYFTILKEHQPEILVDILSRLSVKSLLLCRSVCKSWRDLISSSDFVTEHLSRAVRSGIDSTNSAFRFLFIRRPPYFPHYMHDRRTLENLFGYVANKELPEIIDYQSLKKSHDAHVQCTKLDEFPVALNQSNVVGSCNGLICLQENDYVQIQRDVRAYKRFILWNPSTREFRKLPDLDYFPGALFYGFGYDSTTQDYKVVLGRKTYTAIFALKAGSWKVIDHEEVKIRGKGCLLNGALHWAVEMEGSTIIMCFDLAEVKFHSLSFIGHGHHINSGLRTIGNCLQFYADYWVANHEMVDADHVKHHQEITIWVMLEYGLNKPWTILEKICMEFVGEELSWSEPVSILEDGEILFVSRLHADQYDLVFYIPNEEEEIYKKALDITSMGKGVELVAMYMETLVSPVTGSSSYI